MKIILLACLLTGCNLKMVYAGQAYMDRIVDLCDEAGIQEFNPRNGKVICKGDKK